MFKDQVGFTFGLRLPLRADETDQDLSRAEVKNTYDALLCLEMFSFNSALPHSHSFIFRFLFFLFFSLFFLFCLFFFFLVIFASNYSFV